MDAVGDDARLRAGERNGGDAQRMQRDGGQRDGVCFPGGQQHVHLPFAGIWEAIWQTIYSADDPLGNHSPVKKDDRYGIAW